MKKRIFVLLLFIITFSLQSSFVQAQSEEFTGEIETYSLSLKLPAKSYTEAHQSNTIWVYFKPNSTFAKAQLNFVPKDKVGSSLYAHYLDIDERHIEADFDESKYAEVLDLLRKEKKLIMRVFSEIEPYNSITGRTLYRVNQLAIAMPSLKRIGE